MRPHLPGWCAHDFLSCSSNTPLQTGSCDVTPQDAAETVLPDLHNVHIVEALEPCAFLDIISPPYSNDRRCTYYTATAADDAGATGA